MSVDNPNGVAGATAGEMGGDVSPNVYQLHSIFRQLRAEADSMRPDLERVEREHDALMDRKRLLEESWQALGVCWRCLHEARLAPAPPADLMAKVR